MADGSHIEWTDATWNPLVGCTRVSPGCDNCYAEKDVNRRHAAALSVKTSPKMLEAFPSTFDQVNVRPERFLTQPLRWAKPRRIFVNSLSDLFHSDVPDEFVAAVFAAMALAPQHTFQLLTKRHARMRSLLSSDDFVNRVWWEAGKLAIVRNSKGVLAPRRGLNSCQIGAWPLPNVWLGVSVEDQHWADIRIPALLDTPATVRWISAEPLLGPVDLTYAIGQYTLGLQLDDCLRCCVPASVHGEQSHEFVGPLDWIVVGGESGPKARPMHPAWARDLRDLCDVADTPFLFKQWGRWAPFVPGGRLTITQTASFHMHPDGSGAVWARRNDGGVCEMWPLGKTAAGRELDGRTHDGYPAARVGAR